VWARARDVLIWVVGLAFVGAVLYHLFRELVCD
jgi:hypothetical protein